MVSTQAWVKENLLLWRRFFHNLFPGFAGNRTGEYAVGRDL